MDRLISDIVVRRTGQVIVLGMLLALMALCLWLDSFVHLRKVGRLDDLEPAIAVFDFLAAPLQQTFSALIALIAAVVPVVFSSVCYRVDTSVSPAVAGSQLNRIGHVAFVLTLLGLLVGAGTLILFTADKVAVTDLAATEQNAAAIQGLVNGIVAFNGVYFTQLLGLKPK